MCSIRESGRERVRVFYETQQHEDHQFPPAMDKQAVSMPAIKVRKSSGELEGWKLMKLMEGWKLYQEEAPASSKNRLTALITEEEPDVSHSKGRGSLDSKPCRPARKKR